MIYHKMLDLQLFAEGEGGGEGASTGVTSADAGQAALEALGVPKSKMRTRAKEAAGHMVQSQKPQQTGQAAADNNTAGSAEEGAEGKNAKPTWKELMKDPEYNAAMQETVANRLKTSKSAKDMEILAPALAMLAGRYKLDADPDKLDLSALAKAITEDSSYFEGQAAEMGVDPDVARRLAQLEALEKQKQAQDARAAEQERTRAHLLKLSQQAEELKEKFPGFDLMQELKNPAFARLTAPALGMSVEAAYHAVHYEEIQKQMLTAAMQKATENIAASVASGKSRPAEHGTTGQAPSVSAFNYDNMTKEQRADLRRRVKNGEKIYPV